MTAVLTVTERRFLLLVLATPGIEASAMPRGRRGATLRRLEAAGLIEYHDGWHVTDAGLDLAGGDIRTITANGARRGARYVVEKSDPVDVVGPPSYFVIDSAVDDAAGHWHETRAAAQAEADKLNGGGS